MRRCRPLLGTFVEIKMAGLGDAALNCASEKAFAQIERIQSLMSVHDDASEISCVNAEAFLHPIKVSDETFVVLERGLAIARASAGAFDFTVAPTLARWGLLPARLRRRAQGDWRDVVLLRGRRVRFTRPLAIDLGGIAKGFAVDAAISSLRSSSVTSASVNAGGDLRVFGPDTSRIHLRKLLYVRERGVDALCEQRAVLCERRHEGHAFFLRRAALALSEPGRRAGAASG